jgi:hypothetical protein
MPNVIRQYFYADPGRDLALLAWLEQQDNKSETIRQALRARMDSEKGHDPGLSSHGLDEMTLRRVLREELAGLALAGRLSDAQAGQEDGELAEAIGGLLGVWDFG